MKVKNNASGSAVLNAVPPEHHIKKKERREKMPVAHFVKDIRITGVMDEKVRFVLERQMKCRPYWQKFTEVFSTHEDIADEGWRGEYFGKMLRGAAWIYRYDRDEELYSVMTAAVRDMLSRQDDLGRFSTYPQDAEFRGWDIWCRKYVLTGLLSYRQICRDRTLCIEIDAALKRHLDYLVEKIGEGEGQIPMTQTSSWWGAVNSCSILESVLAMYQMTGEKRYLDFAAYILSTGGCRDGDLIELAFHDKKLPHEYPVVKAYEMISFFEGVLAYYETTGKEQYYRAVCRFVEAVFRGEITIIGCAGCTHELFDHAAVKQTEYSETIMQETCVTVTWMRLLTRLYLLSGEEKYIDRIERSGFNALYGSLNTEWNEQYSFERKKYVEAMAIDSYSPLYMNKRGRGIGGYKEFASGGHYGCCIAIAACGFALMPLSAVLRTKDGYIVNFLCNAAIEGKDHTLLLESCYPANGRGVITVRCEKPVCLELKLRRPSWCRRMTVEGKAVECDGYYTVNRFFKDGDKLSVEWQTELQIERLNGKIAFTYGPLVLAADAKKTDADISLPVHLTQEPEYELLPPEKGELVRLSLKTKDGNLLLTDYQSCGKKWLEKDAVMSAWLKEG